MVVARHRTQDANYVLRVKAPFKLEQVADGTWRAAHKGLGLIVHGDTAKEAAEKMSRAGNFMYDSLLKLGGIDRLREHLVESKVDFELDPLGGPTEVDFPERILDAV